MLRGEGDKMDLGQALTISLDYERKVRDHYAKGLDAISEASGKKVFETMAREEQGHVDYLEGRLDEWKRMGRVSSAALQSVMPSSEWLQGAKARLAQNPSKRLAGKDEIELVKVALQLEKETSTFYRSLVGKLAKDEQALFERFLEIEDGHVTIVQAQLDSLQGLGYWFDFQEFSLEAQ